MFGVVYKISASSFNAINLRYCTGSDAYRRFDSVRRKQFKALMLHHFNTDNASYITVRFPCPYCNEEVESWYIELPVENLLAKNDSESYECEDGDATCQGCDEIYYFSVCIGNNDGYVKFDELYEIKNVLIDTESNEDFNQYYKDQLEAIEDNTHLFATFELSIDRLKRLNKVDAGSAELNKILQLQIYTASITALETFLGDTMINLTLSSEKRIKNFVEAYPDFKRQKFELKEVFNQYEKIRGTVRNVLLETIFHDLRKVREMFRSTFQITFPDISEVTKCIIVRHDIVHRNGKSKGGQVQDVDSVVVANTIDIIHQFAKSIAVELKIV